MVEKKKTKVAKSKFSLGNVVISAFFGALGPFFNKSANLDEAKPIYKLLIENGISYMIYPLNVLLIILMLWSNTISVKYKMLSYKYDGAFIGTTFIFILGYLFSSVLDYLLDTQILSTKRLVGALCIILGVLLISFQESEQKVLKQTNSVLVLVDRITSPPGRASSRPVEPETEARVGDTGVNTIGEDSKHLGNAEPLKEPLVDKTVEYVEPTYTKKDDAISQQPDI